MLNIPGRTVTTNVVMDTISNSSAQQQQSMWQHSPLAAEMPGASPTPQFDFGLGLEASSPAADLHALDSLLDLPLYDPTESPTALIPSTWHSFLQPQPPSFAQQPAHQPPYHNGFCTTDALPSSMPDRQQPSPIDTSVPLSVPAPALQPLTAHPPLTAIWAERTTSCSHSPSPHPASSSPLPFDIQSLLDDPLTASFISTQLGKPRTRSTHRPNPLPNPPSPPAPIAKPKRKKVRPKDTIDALHQQIDSITTHIQHLTLRNHRVQRKKDILATFIKELANLEVVAAEIQTSIQCHKTNPSAAPPNSPATLQTWTTGRFREAYRKVVCQSTEWVLKVEEAGGNPSPAEEAELEGAILEFLRVTLYASYGRVDFMARFMAEQLQLYSGAVPEEEHWRNVLKAMELTEEQVDDLMVAREVFLQCSDNVGREHSNAVAFLQQRSQKGTAASAAMESFEGKDQVTTLANSIRKIHTLNTILVLFWFKHALKPLQAARALMHAYPLIPGGMLTAIALPALRGQRPSMPLLGPQPSHMAGARMIAALQRMAGSPPNSAPPAPSSIP